MNHKSTTTAYLLWLFFGGLGIHQFYLGKTGRGISMLLTFGWLTLGLWVDLFTLPRQVRRVNAMTSVTHLAHGKYEYTTRV